MNKADLQPMFDYHYWAHRHVWDCLMKLTDAQFEQDLDYSIGSLHRQCTHVIATEWMWLTWAQDRLPADRQQWFDTSPLQDRPAVRAAWDNLERETRAYLRTVEDEQLNAIVTYEFPWCGKQSHPRWMGLMYIITHAVDHRAQMLAGIHRLGGETVMQDLIRQVWGLQA